MDTYFADYTVFSNLNITILVCNTVVCISDNFFPAICLGPSEFPIRAKFRFFFGKKKIDSAREFSGYTCQYR